MWPAATQRSRSSAPLGLALGAVLSLRPQRPSDVEDRHNNRDNHGSRLKNPHPGGHRRPIDHRGAMTESSA
jgi:hypothetical protein